MLRPEDQSFLWRCDHCGTGVILDGNGGALHCACPPDSNPTWHFQNRLAEGRFPQGVWYDPATMLPEDPP